MKINDLKKDSLTFKDLKMGDVFKNSEGVYIAIEYSNCTNAINLKDGNRAYFDDIDRVTKVNATLTIE